MDLVDRVNCEKSLRTAVLCAAMSYISIVVVPACFSRVRVHRVSRNRYIRATNIAVIWRGLRGQYEGDIRDITLNLVVMCRCRCTPLVLRFW